MSILTTPWRVLDEIETPSLAFYCDLTGELPKDGDAPIVPGWLWSAIEHAWDTATLADRLIMCLREVGISEAFGELVAAARRKLRGVT